MYCSMYREKRPQRSTELNRNDFVYERKGRADVLPKDTKYQKTCTAQNCAIIFSYY